MHANDISPIAPARWLPTYCQVSTALPLRAVLGLEWDKLQPGAALAAVSTWDQLAAAGAAAQTRQGSRHLQHSGEPVHAICLPLDHVSEGVLDILLKARHHLLKALSCPCKLVCDFGSSPC